VASDALIKNSRSVTCCGQRPPAFAAAAIGILVLILLIVILTR
jgi:hypothetical protein